MPVNRIKATPRGRAAVAAALVAAGVSGWVAFTKSDSASPPAAITVSAPVSAPAPAVTPATVRAALAAGLTPPAVDLAVTRLIKPWEGLILRAHWDRFGKVWDICYGDTLIDGKPVRPSMTMTREQCEDILRKRVIRDYYLSLVDRVPGYVTAPVSLQASMISGAYNFGTGRQIGSKTAELTTRGRYREACDAQTAFNKAGGQILNGLVKRREMGDEQRLGEAELCVSGLQ